MTTHTLQIIGLLFVTILIVWLYFKAQMHSTKKSLKEANKNLEKTFSKLQFLLTEKDALKKEQEKFKHLKADITNNNNSLKKQMRDVNRENEANIARLKLQENLKSKYDETSAILKDAQKELTNLRLQARQIERTQDELNSAQEENTLLKKQLNHFKTIENSFEVANSKAASQEEEITALKEKLKRLETEKRKNNSELSLLKEDVRNFKHKIELIETESKSLVKQVRDLEKVNKMQSRTIELLEQLKEA
jgi:chromosome segregation ATPase